LDEILRNKYFIRLCGSHSGFGYVFEEVIISVILTLSNETIGVKINKEQLPFNALKEYEIKRIDEKIELSKMEIKENIIYYTRVNPKIDLIIRDEDKIILTQITTVSTNIEGKTEANIKVIVEKIKGIIEAANEIKKNTQIKLGGIKVIGWLISLMDINREKVKDIIEANEWIRIDDGKKLKKILGDKLYNKLISLKVNI